MSDISQTALRKTATKDAIDQFVMAAQITADQSTAPYRDMLESLVDSAPVPTGFQSAKQASDKASAAAYIAQKLAAAAGGKISDDTPSKAEVSWAVNVVQEQGDLRPETAATLKQELSLPEPVELPSDQMAALVTAATSRVSGLGGSPAAISR